LIGKSGKRKIGIITQRRDCELRVDHLGKKLEFPPIVETAQRDMTIHQKPAVKKPESENEPSVKTI
jgi:hypothetical protein